MARPKKTAPESRKHVVKFLLTDAERAALQAEAAIHGVVPNEWARIKATSSGGSIALPPARVESPEMAELRRELARVGVNMNQIARRLNMTGEHEPEELRTAAQRMDEILWRMLAHVEYH